jgi:hypothetical protein
VHLRGEPIVAQAPILTPISRSCFALQELDAVQLSNRLTKVPGLHSFLGFCLFFPSILVGPSFEFSLYHSLVNGTLFLDPPSSSAGKNPNVATTDDTLEKTAALKRKLKDDGGLGASLKTSAIPKGRKRVAYVHMVSLIATTFHLPKSEPRGCDKHIFGSPRRAPMLTLSHSQTTRRLSDSASWPSTPFLGARLHTKESWTRRGGTMDTASGQSSCYRSPVKTCG